MDVAELPNLHQLSVRSSTDLSHSHWLRMNLEISWEHESMTIFNLKRAFARASSLAASLNFRPAPFAPIGRVIKGYRL